MKNIKNLFVAACALLSAVSMAAVQPGVPVSEDAPIRVSAGLHGGLMKNEKGFGTDALGLGLSFAHNVGYDFEYGLGLSGDFAAGGKRLFVTEETKDRNGVRMGVDLMARFMPEVAEKLHLGGILGLGWGTQFGGEALKPEKELVAFGDLAVRVAVGMSYGFSDMVSLYFSPGYTLTGIRFASDKVVDKDAFKKHANLSGVEAPLGLMFSMSDSVGMFVEANTQFTDFQNFTRSWREDVTLGVSFSM
jgi:opacity protein-like surface antigen